MFWNDGICSWIFILLSSLSIVSAMVCGKAASGLERILCGVMVKKNSQESIDRYTGYCIITEILLEMALNTMQSISCSWIDSHHFWKRRNCGWQAFSLFRTMFSTLLTFSLKTNFRLFHAERVSRRQYQIWWKWLKVLQMGRKTLCEKEKLLILSNFFFSQSVFKLIVLQTRKNNGLFGNLLILSQTSPGFYVSEVQIFRNAWLPSGERFGLVTWLSWVGYPLDANFLSAYFHC